jgi:glucose-6-phosphate isomerase/transaldolase/glucose-6-phosphate isomerase
MDLGGEIFRWEFATSVAGNLLGIHPFDQPDVQLAKTRTQSILATFQRGDTPPSPEEGDGAAALKELRPGDAAVLMVYGDPDDALLAALADLREALQRTAGVATTLGIGPRFLHSTGQLHKGGPNRGVFLQLVLDEKALPIPGEDSLDFARLIRAQADGDFAALRDRERRVARVPTGADPVATVQELTRACR